MIDLVKTLTTTVEAVTDAAIMVAGVTLMTKRLQGMLRIALLVERTTRRGVVKEEVATATQRRGSETTKTTLSDSKIVIKVSETF